MSIGDIARIDGPLERARLELELRGAHQPYVVSDSAQRWWVLKPLAARGILAESIGGLLGRILGVDVPDFALCEENGRLGWLSAFVYDAHHWDRLRLGAVANPEGVGCMLALDAIIHNEDRNTENFIFEQLDEPDCFRCWAIDMESALVARPRALAAKGCKAPHAHALPDDFVVLDEMRAAAIGAAARAALLAEDAVDEVVGVAMTAAGTLDREILSGALRTRCRQAPQIVEDYLDQLARG